MRSLAEREAQARVNAARYGSSMPGPWLYERELHPEDGRWCQATTRDGGQCGNRVWSGSTTLCAGHDPERRNKAVTGKRGRRVVHPRVERVEMRLTFVEAATLHVFFEACPDILAAP